jgi:hypothetical protein
MPDCGKKIWYVSTGHRFSNCISLKSVVLRFCRKCFFINCEHVIKNLNVLIEKVKMHCAYSLIV